MQKTLLRRIPRSPILAAGWLACCLCAAAGMTRAQSSAKPGFSVLNALQRLQPSTTEPIPTAPEWVESEPPPALEAPVDPTTYHVLPGDRVHVGVWGEVPQGDYLTVTPEGDLIIPGIGPVHVVGRTLAGAEETVASVLRRFYPSDRLTLRLIQPGKFLVAVTGMVGKPGLYEVTGLQRLSSALELAGGVRPGGSIRGVRTFQAGDSASAGLDAQVDLLPWMLQGNRNANPMLEPGMSIDVPSQGPAVRVRGPVNGRSSIEIPNVAPVRIGDRPEEEPDVVLEWRQGDTVGDVLDQVGGLSERAAGSGILRRGNEPPRSLDLRAAETRSLPTEAGDLLEVTYTNRWVFVVGSVRAPGRYPYLPGLTAGDYVFMAGGPTELGRSTDWTLQVEGQHAKPIQRTEVISPSWTIRVPERRTYKISTLLGPLSSATALVISVVALARKY